MASTTKAVSVTTSAIELIASNKQRIFAMIQNTSATIPVYVGFSNAVTAPATAATAGFLLGVGATFKVELGGGRGNYQYYWRGPFWAISTSGTAVVHVTEMEDSDV
jgi:hypothetical protein